MTKEDLLTSMEIIMELNKDNSVAAQLIWDLWMDHGNYWIKGGRVVHKETGKELGK